MAAKMTCPNCKKVCKEEGDEMKTANGEYRVIDIGAYRIIKCSSCDCSEHPLKWEMFGE